MVVVQFHSVRADVVLEAMSFLPTVLQVKLEVVLFPGTVEVMKYLQPFMTIQFQAAASQPGKPRRQLCTASLKKGTCFLNAILMHRYSDIFFLDDGIVARSLGQQHVIVLPAVCIQLVSLHLQ